MENPVNTEKKQSRQVFSSITAAIYNNRTDIHHQFKTIFSDPIFKRTANLTLEEAQKLAYKRFQHLTSCFELTDLLTSDPWKLLALHDWTAMTDGALFFITSVHYNLCAGTIYEHKAGRTDLEPFLKTLNNGDAAGLYVAVELGYGNNVAMMETTATYDPEKQVFLLNTPGSRSRKFMSHTDARSIPKLGVLLARLKVGDKDHGIFSFVVPFTNGKDLRKGITIIPLIDKPYALDNAITMFKNVELPYESLLTGSFCHFTRDGQLELEEQYRDIRLLSSLNRLPIGMIFFASGCLAMARAALVITTKFIIQRLAFTLDSKKVHVADFKFHQQAIVKGYASIIANTFWLNAVISQHLASAKQSPYVSSVTARHAALIKGIALWESEDVLKACRERCGAQGFLAKNRLVDFVVTNLGNTTGQGDSLVGFIHASKDLLSDKEDEPILPPNGDPLVASWILLFFTAGKMVRNDINNRLDANIGKGVSAFDAWDGEISNAIILGRLYTTRMALMAFSDICSKLTDTFEKKLMNNLLSFYALSGILSFENTLRRNNLINNEQVEITENILCELLAKIAPHLRYLADTFDLPLSFLQAPIAYDDYIHQM